MLYIGGAFFSGVKEGLTTTDNGKKNLNIAPEDYDLHLIDVNFDPKWATIVGTADSITFDNGEKIKMIHLRGGLLVPDKKWEDNYYVVINVLNILCVLLYISLLIQFVRFIININKGNIFDQKNISRLRKFAWYLISISVIKCMAGIIDDFRLSKLSLELDGYSLSTYWEMPWDTMLLGLLALLMAQVWSYGLQLKEDQALTI